MESQGKKPIIRRHTDTHLECRCCFEMKLFTDFHKDKTGPFGLAYWCKPCAIINSRKHHRRRIEQDDVAYKTAKRESHYKTTYGITLTEKYKMLENQGNQCAICKTHLEHVGYLTHLDHDHKTNKIRAVLCTNCNRGLGSFKDNPTFLQSAIEYLKHHTENGTQKEGSCP